MCPVTVSLVERHSTLCSYWPALGGTLLDRGEHAPGVPDAYVTDQDGYGIDLAERRRRGFSRSRQPYLVGIREPNSWRRYAQNPMTTHSAIAASPCSVSSSNAGNGARAGTGTDSRGQAISSSIAGNSNKALSSRRAANTRA